MANVIEASNLKKSFGTTKALDGLDLEVERGRVHGFLGPNGAGKSTAIRVLLGMIRADSGEARVLGMDPWRESRRIHHRIAYVPGEVNLWPNLTGGETLDLLGGLRGGVDEARRDELCELFELDLRAKGGSYSRGNRQKVALVAALATNAEVYFFDEPTAGLDPLKEVAFQQCVNEIRDEGGTVLLSSHILAQVEELTDDLTIIRNGRAIESGSLAEMRQLARSQVEATLASDPSGLDLMPGVHDVSVEGNRIRCSVEPGQLQELLRWLLDRDVSDLVTRPPTLEDLFLREYGKEDDG